MSEVNLALSTQKSWQFHPPTLLAVDCDGGMLLYGRVPIANVEVLGMLEEVKSRSQVSRGSPILSHVLHI